ncbi:MAG: cobalamin biosynthesis protein CbiM [Elusimicrobia bacterium RIFOXYA2_FULL_39_19]|nr:MAG: cobalamin biosynthesis protein CbiM [Elusimicrobia bacterium RIFOXYA2_FULL_39_19]
MHIPDGFLDVKTIAITTTISVLCVGIGVKKINRNIEEKQIPMLGVIAAFVFAAQMLNFPVAGGTSGHFMGSMLGIVLLGPLSTLLIMSMVLIVQCFVFQDGGLTALGANVFNMGIVGPIAGYLVYSSMLKLKINKMVCVFIAAWLSIVAAASFCAIELTISGIVPFKTALLSMAGIHSIIGVGEGLITITVLTFITKARPDLLEMRKI